MNAQDLRNLLENSNDKFNMLIDEALLSQYTLKIRELVELVDDFLSDEQKAQLFAFDYYQKRSPFIKSQIILTISDDKIKLGLLKKFEIKSEMDVDYILSIMKSLSPDGKIQLLHEQDLLQQYNITTSQIENIVESLSEEKQIELLADKDFVQNELHVSIDNIFKLVLGFKNEQRKLNMLDLYEFSNNQIESILKTFSCKNRITILIENKYQLGRQNIKNVISTFNVDQLVDFLKDDRQFLEQNDIYVYEITRDFSKEMQLDFINKMEETSLSLIEKRKILATLKEETKREIDTSNFPLEYVTAIEMQIHRDVHDRNTYGQIMIDFDKDLEIYRGLDELITINPMNITAENKQKFTRLCRICPQISVMDNLEESISTGEEYLRGEACIESILQEINPEWSDIQKIAFIDHKIGKKISYSPDIGTEVFNKEDAQALWKIIDSGYGVCDGISQVEQYILSKIGIASEMVSSKNHAFLKLKNIELPNENGELVRGDTILDPTWNLRAHRYNTRPENFCKSYEEIRKNDIDDNGVDTKCHENDEQLASVTLELSVKSLKDVFKSIGLTDKDGIFPAKELIEKSKLIDDSNFPEEEWIKRQFALLTEYCPEFAICQNETMSILQAVTFNQKNQNFNRCVVNRVYEREDESKRPVVYVYMNLPESGKKFYFADKDIGQFVELPQKEFESRFECYEMDLQKQEGHRPWEDLDKTENLQQAPEK